VEKFQVEKSDMLKPKLLFQLKRKQEDGSKITQNSDFNNDFIQITNAIGVCLLQQNQYMQDICDAHFNLNLPLVSLYLLPSTE